MTRSKDYGQSCLAAIASDLEVMAPAWLGDTDVKADVRSGTLDLEGSSQLRLTIYDWIGLSGLSIVSCPVAPAPVPCHPERSVSGVEGSPAAAATAVPATTV